MIFPLCVSPGKEMGGCTRQRKKSPTLAGVEPTTSRFDHRLLYRLNYEAREEQVASDLWWSLRQSECDEGYK